MKKILLITMTLLLTSCGAVHQVCGSDIKMLCNALVGEKPEDETGLAEKIDDRIDVKLAELEQSLNIQINQANQNFSMIQMLVNDLETQFNSDISHVTSLINVLTTQVEDNTEDILSIEAAILTLEGNAVSMVDVCGETLIKQGVGSAAKYIAAMNVFNTVDIPTASLSGSIQVSNCNITSITIPSQGAVDICIGVNQVTVDTFEEETYQLKYLKSVYLAELDEDTRFRTTTNSTSCEFEIQNGAVVQF